MKRKRILTQYLLYFIMLMFLLVAGCSSGDDDNTPAETPVDAWVTVSGTVTTAGGTPVAGVIISSMFNLEVLNINILEGSFSSDYFGTCFTDDAGHYTMTVPAALAENYTLVITPAKKGYTFTPANRTLTIVASTDQTGVNFTAVVKDVFSQSDLEGIWRVNMLKAGTEQWMRSRISVNGSGVATCLSYETSDAPGVTDCPDTGFALTMTMGDGDDDGVVTQTGAYATASHMTMSSNKHLMAGTGTTGIGASSSYQLTVAQKEPVDLTNEYTASDVQNRAFVFHSLSVGATNEWRYGSGYTDLTTGLIHQDAGSEFSSGTAGTTLNGMTVAVDADGVVTIAEIPTFRGFLSDDEMTVVGTYSAGTSVADYKLMVIQFVSTVGQAPASTATGFSINHLLATGTTPFWAYEDINISRFETTFLPDILDLEFALNLLLSYNFECSLPLADFTQIQRLTRISLNKLNISDITNPGEATILDSTDAVLFHGQLAFDGKFMVGVETMTLTINDVATPFYALDIITH